jgi:hypothetical protein
MAASCPAPFVTLILDTLVSPFLCKTEEVEDTIDKAYDTYKRQE